MLRNRFSTSDFRQLRILAILSMAWMFYALDGSVISVLFLNRSFNETFGLSDTNRLGLFGLAPAIGAIIGTSGIAGLINRAFGRKKTFQIATVLVIIGVILQTFPDKWGALVVGRIVMGIGGDTNGICVGLYVTETAPKELRGRLLIIIQHVSGQVTGIAGAWIAYGIAYLPQNKSYSWKVANSLQFIPGVAFFILVFWLPESPRWLAKKYPDNDEPIISALCQLRGLDVSNQAIRDEAEEIRKYNSWELEHSQAPAWNIFTDRRLRRRMGFAFIPVLCSQLMGAGVLSVYAVIIFQRLGLNDPHNALLLTSCLSILYALAAIVSAWLIERIGRRTCLRVGITVNLVGIAVVTGLAWGLENKASNSVGNIFIVIFIVAVLTNQWLFWNGPVVVYIQEILPNNAREIGVGVINCIPIGIAVAMGQQWPTATQKLGAKSYLILFSTAALAWLLVWIFVRETKGLSIERIDVVFGESDHVEDRVTEEVERGGQTIVGDKADGGIEEEFIELVARPTSQQRVNSNEGNVIDCLE